MSSEPIRFTDGTGYDRFMGVWNRLAGQTFLDWIAPSPGQRWLDVGCGNGAFTQLIAEQCAPASRSLRAACCPAGAGFSIQVIVPT
jgi:hypothetical protein